MPAAELLTIERTRVRYQRPDQHQAPAVVVLPEIFGVNDDIRAIADRFAVRGYATAVVDLYSGGPKPVCITRTVLDAFRNAGTGGAERVERVRRWLAAQPEVRDDRIGVIGFCMSAGIAVMAASVGEFQAAAINYGEVPEDISVLEGICPVVASYGADDRRLLPSVRRLEEALERFGVPHDVRVYEGAGHSFLNRSVPGLVQRVASVGYRGEQAEHAWGRIDAFFEQHLRGPA